MGFHGKIKQEKGLLRVYYGHFDGVSRGNPGEAAVGAYLVDENGEVVWEKSERVGVHTNNEAEYLALIALLEEVARRDIKEITVYGDSQLVVNQVNGHWNINHAHLYELYRRADRLMRGREVRLVWVPREKNMRADKLANQAFKKTAIRKEFDPSRLERVTDYIFIAHGTEDYAVDVLHESCSCPAFRNYRGDCKHLVAAKRVVQERSACRTVSCGPV